MSPKELPISPLPAYDDAEVEVTHTAKGAQVEHGSVSAHLTGMSLYPEISHYLPPLRPKLIQERSRGPKREHPASSKKGRATASWTMAFPPVSRMHRPPTFIFERGLSWGVERFSN